MTRVVWLCLMGVAAAMAGDTTDVVKLEAVMERVRPLHKPLDKPGPMDWLACHPESGQTFKEYLESDPVTPRGKRHVIYVQPIGDFTATQRKIIDQTADFLGRYYSIPVRIQRDLPLSMIPGKARRKHPEWGDEQILTSYVLDEVLKPELPEDAAVYLALTTSDLWPGEGWNFVFGQASLRSRTGVWSIYRNGDPGKSDADFRLCLLRTLKTAAHETGHMFSMMHCIKYQCCMNGSNHRAEADRRPLWLCPECMAKVCWAVGADPAGRYRKLAEFCGSQGLTTEADFYRQSIERLESR